MFGYNGKFLLVDLTSGQIGALDLSEDQAKSFVGGAGLSAALIYDVIKKGIDPLAPESPLIFAVGPLTGSTIPMVSRSSVCGISPLTGLWGEATTGGIFPFRLKAAGFDGIFITGKAKRPVYLYVKNGHAEIKDATHLWGHDIYQTQKIIHDEIKETGMSISCIGEAGEKLVRYACIMNDRGRAAGRCGMGTLMGSKNLKAVITGGNARSTAADTEKIAMLTRQARDTIASNFMSVAYREYGTLLYMDMAMVLGDAPAKYFSKSVFPVRNITGQALREAYTVTNYACQGCPIGCGRSVKNFKKGVSEIDGPEYETAVAFGPLLMNTDLDSVVWANHLCNAAGIDTISAGVCIAYAIDLFEKGILSEKKAGIKLTWGDAPTIVKLVEMIIKQQGIGKLLGEGTKRMAETLGADPETAANVKGLEMAMHDARAFTGEAISYATGPRGACHLKGDYYNVDLGGAFPEIGVSASDRMQVQGKAEMAAKFQSFKDLFDSMLMCKFAPLTVTTVSEALSGITGWSYSPQDILTAGDRSINLKRAINNKLGVTRQDDKLPVVCSQPLDEGSTVGKSPDMETLLKDYYTFRKWDWATGKPSREKLVELGLIKASKDLWG
jgi:aldehyde:ferredoxin oxidoreductase